MLHELPADHPDRNRSLAGCWYRWKFGKDWREILPTYQIAKVTYNDLGPSWTEPCDFSWSPFDTKPQVS